MDIIFDNNRIKKRCHKATGKLKRRLDDMRAADNLEIMMTLPGRCHPLKADRKGLWALDIDQPYRLLIKPVIDPLPISKDGWIDLTKVTAVCIVAVEDYHGT